MIQSASQKVNKEAGDGTTTVTILCQYLISQGMAAINGGANPVDLNKGINKAVYCVVESLKKQSTPIVLGTNYQELKQIATTSANNDPVIGEIIADVVSQAGLDGLITVSRSINSENRIEKLEGMSLTSRIVSDQLIMDEGLMRTELIAPIILIYDRTVSKLSDVQHFLGHCTKNKKPLLIIAEDVEGEVLATLLTTKSSKLLVAIKAPGLVNRNEILRDIATFTGGQVISEDMGAKLQYTSIDKLGTAKKVVVTKTETFIIDGGGSKQSISTRLKELKTQYDAQINEQAKKLLHERIAVLSLSKATLWVGAPTQLELDEKIARIDDALRATRCAIDEGILPGGGTAFIRSLDCLNVVAGDNKDETKGIEIVEGCLHEPIRQICINAGIITADGIRSVINKIYAGGKNPTYGYNAKTEQFCDMLSAGVIDPTKVVRISLEVAASTATMFLTTEGIIADILE